MRIVAFGGTTRAASSTAAALESAAQAARDQGADVTTFDGPMLAQLPHYCPETPARHPTAVDLAEAIRGAHGVIVASPGYHGTVSGLVKNAVDYLQDLAGDPRPYLSDLPVGCITTAHGPQAAVSTLQTLRTIVHSLRGWPTPYGASIVLGTDPAYDRCRLVGEQVVSAVRAQLVTVART